MHLISFLGSMALHVNIVWVYHCCEHRNGNASFSCDLLCQKTRRTTCCQVSLDENPPCQADYYPCYYSKRSSNFSNQCLPSEDTEYEVATLKRKVSESVLQIGLLLTRNVSCRSTLQDFRGINSFLTFIKNFLPIIVT